MLGGPAAPARSSSPAPYDVIDWYRARYRSMRRVSGNCEHACREWGVGSPKEMSVVFRPKACGEAALRLLFGC
ncbi:hypothetical protein chiPu_0017226 [Chiloscyllium punctatum]|uniref:Uncharacterized protein n=1 Tax=Chiloscyllium punctatum TaxID=137246 RepID=A0A401T7U3_CHIPU|nr:hypothetical protein [Chiloscyllium punctatum]